MSGAARQRTLSSKCIFFIRAIRGLWLFSMGLPEPPDELGALLDGVRAGDEEALTQLLQKYEPRLRTAARVLLGPWLRPHLDSLDLIQSVHRELLPGLRQGKYDLGSTQQLLALALTVVRR